MIDSWSGWVLWRDCPVWGMNFSEDRDPSWAQTAAAGDHRPPCPPLNAGPAPASALMGLWAPGGPVSSMYQVQPILPVSSQTSLPPRGLPWTPDWEEGPEL